MNLKLNTLKVKVLFNIFSEILRKKLSKEIRDDRTKYLGIFESHRWESTSRDCWHTF